MFALCFVLTLVVGMFIGANGIVLLCLHMEDKDAERVRRMKIHPSGRTDQIAVH